MANSTLAIRDPNNPGPQGAFRSQPLSDSPLFDISPHDSTLVIVDRRATSADRFSVVKVTPRGDTLHASRIPYSPQPLPEGLVSRLIEEQVEGALRSPAVGHLGRATLEELVREALHVPPAEPPVSAVVVASDAGVWLRREALERDTVEWLVLDAALQPVGRTRLPARISVREVTADHIWAVERDSNDVESLVRLRIVRDR